MPPRTQRVSYRAQCVHTATCTCGFVCQVDISDQGVSHTSVSSFYLSSRWVLFTSNILLFLRTSAFTSHVDCQRRLSRGGGKWGRGRRTPNNYDDDSLIGTTPTSVELVETPAPSTTHPEPCLTREPSTTAPALSLTPAPSTTAPVRSTMAPVPAMADPVPRRTPEPLTTPTDMDILLDLHNEAR